MNFNFPKIDIPKIDLPNLDNLLPTLRNIPTIPKLELPRITSAIEQLEHSNLINDIDQLNYNIKLKQTEKENYERRFKSISSVDITAGIWCSIVVAILSIIIPFLIVSFNNYLEDYQTIIFIYMIASFIISMIILLGYLVYSYKSKK